MWTRTILAVVSILGFSSSAYAQSYSQPPGHQPLVQYRSDDESYLPPPRPCPCEDSSWRKYDASPVRFHVGVAGRMDTDSVTAGLLTAVDFGRGPAGFRATGAWLRVGSPDGLAQYSGELTLDIAPNGPWRPVVGAGAGVARTYRVDDNGNRIGGGSTLGVGVMRVAIEYRLPIDRADSRVGASIMGVLPALRADGAPDLKGWAIAALTVGVGF